MFLKFAKIIFALVLTYALISCAGTGSIKKNALIPIINGEKGNIVVVRDPSSIFAPLSVWAIYLNGTVVGSLGISEKIVIPVKEGTNRLDAKITGISGMGMKTDSVVFQSNKSQNNYFFVSMEDISTFARGLVIRQSTECVWANKLRINLPYKCQNSLNNSVASKPKQKPNLPIPKGSLKPRKYTQGSGFFVSKLGHVVTNEHVVRKCYSVTVGDNANKKVAASVLETDKRNDLALLRISSTKTVSAETKSLISKLGVKKLGMRVVPLASGGLMRSDDIELGEKVLVAGFPYGELYSNTIKVTGGMVSAVKGIGDDSAQFQIDAAVQPGNSGGPIYDENGNIVGVVVAQLNKLKVAKTIGSLPENVNFGIKASTVRQFLTSAGLPTKWSKRTEQKTTRELAKIAKLQTVMVMCNR